MTVQDPSPDFERFLVSVEGVGRQWEESVDVEALLRLPKAERHQAEVILIERLEIDDVRAPYALAEAECRGAVAPMKRRMAEANGRMKVAMALALASLEAIPQADEIIAKVLREGDPDGGLAALVAAEDMRSEPIRDALAWSCLHHPAPEVRCNAGALLFLLAQLTDDPLAWDYRPLYLKLGEPDEKTRRRAFEQICGIVGMSPELAG